MAERRQQVRRREQVTLVVYKKAVAQKYVSVSLFGCLVERIHDLAQRCRNRRVRRVCRVAFCRGSPCKQEAQTKRNSHQRSSRNFLVDLPHDGPHPRTLSKGAILIK